MSYTETKLFFHITKKGIPGVIPHLEHVLILQKTKNANIIISVRTVFMSATCDGEAKSQMTTFPI